MKLEQLQQFLAVCQHQSLMEAAKQLHRTPSAVSMTLKQLEQSLGGALFEGDRKQQLTPLGRFVHDRAARSVGEHLRALDDIDRYARGESGSVRLMAVPSAATGQLTLAIARCLSEEPALDIELHDTDSRAVKSAVLNGSADLGVASLAAPDERLRQRLLSTDAFVCVCGEQHPLAKDSSALQLGELQRHRFIHNGLCEQIDNSTVQGLSAQAQLRVYNVSSLLAMVRQGVGVSLLPADAVQRSHGIHCRAIVDTLPLRSLYLLSRSDRSPSPAVGLVGAAIEAQYRTSR